MATQYPPGPQGTPLLGSLRELRRDRLNFVANTAKTYGDIAHFHFGTKDAYLLNHSDFIHQVLVSQADKFQKADTLRKNANKLIGDGILTSEGEFHRKQRKLVQPAFHHARIAAYATTMVDYTQQLIAHWQSGATYDMHDEMMTLTRDIIAKTLFDADLGDQGNAVAEAITTALKSTNERFTSMVRLPDWFPTRSNRRRQESVDLLNGVLTKIIDSRRESGADTGDLLSMLLLAVNEDDGSGMDDDQAREEAMTLFIAGHETTANATAWMWYLLAQHPEVEAKLAEELNTVLAGRAPTMQDLAKLPYNDAIIKESMRLYPPAWMVGIRIAQEDVTLGEYPIAKGSVILMSPWATHRNPRYFSEPDRFMPERWTPEFEKNLPRFAYFPFGGGPRVCIGNSFAMMEARLILATVAQQWQMTLVPGQDITPVPMVTLRPSGSICMTLTRRVQNAIPVTPPETAHAVPA